MIAKTHSLITADDLLAMGDHAWRKELVRGALIDMSPAGGPHGEIAQNIGLFVGAFVRKHGLGKCFAAETGFMLATDPDTVRAPDFAYVSNARLPGGRIPEGYFPGAPDLAVEVLSPSEPAAEIQRKIDEYFTAGARAVWVIDPDAQEVGVYASPAISRRLTLNDKLDGGDMLPGFTCPVKNIFE